MITFFKEREKTRVSLQLNNKIINLRINEKLVKVTHVIRNTVH